MIGLSHRSVIALVGLVAVWVGQSAPSHLRADDGAISTSQVEINEMIRRRCATHEPSEEQKRVAKSLDEMFAEKKKRNPSRSSVSIPVDFHVITSSSGEGNVGDDQVSDQIDVLNSQYGPAGFSFYLAGTSSSPAIILYCFIFRLSTGKDTTTNDAWFVMDTDSADERAAKMSLRTGSI